MKLSKRILSALTSFVCAASVSVAAISIESSAAEESIVSDGVTYVLLSDHAEVKGGDLSVTKVDILDHVVNLPVTAIQSNAFVGCKSLSSVSIPNTVTSIGSSAFNGCTSLVTANIPDSVTRVGTASFYGTAIVNAQSGPVYYVGPWVVDSDSSTAVEIKSDTVGIADQAFYNNKLQSLRIPSGCKYIGSAAFGSNSSLTEVTIPSGVEVIGYSAFESCEYLSVLSIGSNVKEIGGRAFYNCKNLENVTIPSSVTKIGRFAFNETKAYSLSSGLIVRISDWIVDCRDSTENVSVSIDKGVKGIAEGAFSGKSHITSVDIPETVITIGENAFYGCSDLSRVTIPEGVQNIESYAFSGTLLPSVVLPESVSYVGYNAFSNCKNLTDVTVKNPNCTIYPSEYTLGGYVKLHVYANSTAEEYAKKYSSKTFAYMEGDKYELGDVDRNGSINIFDAVAIAKYTVGKETFDAEQLALADYDKKGGVNIFDAVAVARASIK